MWEERDMSEICREKDEQAWKMTHESPNERFRCFFNGLFPAVLYAPVAAGVFVQGGTSTAISSGEFSHTCTRTQLRLT